MYVTRMLRVFGVSHACPSELGFGGSETSAPGASREDMQGPVLAVLASFRDDVRLKARSSKDPETKACILHMCDRCRISHPSLLSHAVWTPVADFSFCGMRGTQKVRHHDSILLQCQNHL